MLVDDDHDVRQLIGFALASEGYTVEAASTAEEGLEMLRRRSFTLILTDYALPGQTGTWMLRTAKELGLLRGAPALMVTAHPYPEQLPGVGLIQKPLDLDCFLEEIRVALTTRQPV